MNEENNKLKYVQKMESPRSNLSHSMNVKCLVK